MFIVLLALEVTLLSALEVDNKEIDNNDVSTPPVNLDGNLRRALLKALKELENEETQKPENSDKENIFEKASASAVSVLANDNVLLVSSTPTTVISKLATSTQQPLVLLQKSEGEHKLTISTFEKDTDSDQFLTSATSNFAVSKQEQEKSNQNSKIISSSRNLISNENKATAHNVDQTTVGPVKTSTEESEAKVENVQFFSAPLVAAFTVHQDELGLPNKVEQIFKPGAINEISTTVRSQEILKNEDPTKIQEQLRLKQLQLQQKQQDLEDEIAKLNVNVQQEQQLPLQQHVNFRQHFIPNPPVISTQEKSHVDDVAKFQNQLELEQRQIFQQKQKALEEEVLRANLNLKHQQQLAFQQQLKIQQQNFLLQQEQLRLRAIQSPSPPNPVLSVGQSVFSTVQQLPTKEAQQFNGPQSTISLLPSITFNPLVEAGKLPVNAQFLPIKGPGNFHASPTIQPVFQKFSSSSQLFPNFIPSNNFQQQQLPLVSNNIQGTRFFRHETGVGNFDNKGFNQPSSTFSIQKSIQSPQITETNFVRHTVNPFISNHLELPRHHSQHKQFFPSSNSFSTPQFSDSTSQTPRNRFFRSNLESSFNAPSSFHGSRSNTDQIGNLLFTSGALRGKSQEDLSLISKVLSLNHSGDNNFRSLVRHFRTV